MQVVVVAVVLSACIAAVVIGMCHIAKAADEAAEADAARLSQSRRAALPGPQSRA